MISAPLTGNGGGGFVELVPTARRSSMILGTAAAIHIVAAGTAVLVLHRQC
jgi:hypothetical protein